MTFLDLRGIDGGFADQRGQDDNDGNRPTLSLRRHPRDSERDHCNRQQRIREEMIDRQPDHRDQQRQYHQLESKLEALRSIA